MANGYNTSRAAHVWFFQDMTVFLVGILELCHCLADANLIRSQTSTPRVVTDELKRWFKIAAIVDQIDLLFCLVLDGIRFTLP